MLMRPFGGSDKVVREVRVRPGATEVARLALSVGAGGTGSATAPLMDHLPATPRDQWRRVQLGRYLLDYCDKRVEDMSFDDQGRVTDFGLPDGELDAIIDAGIAFRTSGCPGKFAEDISACDRPYGDSPPSNIASYPFQPGAADMRKIRHQLGREKPGETYVEGEEFEDV